MLLSDLKIRNLKPESKAYRVRDGEGLYLRVTPNGGKAWQIRYFFGDKERILSAGSYPRVSLQEARELRLRAKKLVDQNIDPCSEKRRERIEAHYRDRNTFRLVAEEWFEARQGDWTPRHARKIWHRLETYIFPDLGKRSIADVKPLDVLRVIQKLDARNATEMSRCQLSACRRIFKYAVVTGRIQYNPAADLECALRRHRVKHHPTLRAVEIGEFLRAFEKFDCQEVYKLGFEILILTALRTGELRYSKWSDIHFERQEWVVRAEVMKMKETHVVPLSSQALSALRRLELLTGDQEWLFPNVYQQKRPVISENFVNNIIRRIGYKDRIVGHGFRSMFSTVLNEHGFNRDAIERQLAHKERNQVRAAYNRAEYWEERRFIMQWWGDFLTAVRSGIQHGQIQIDAGGPRLLARFGRP
ncbi:MAG: tyrosine-type recombinase/integrase [Armatimonadetes bacterium]|nr:tyrosine-type recombinase/integrase [Akkermansiaceae bacterium]